MRELVEFTKFYNNLGLTYEKEEYIYHYTSAPVAKIILDEGTLRLTDSYFLNDYSEGRYVFELCNKNLEQLIDDVSFRKEVKKNWKNE